MRYSVQPGLSQRGVQLPAGYFGDWRVAFIVFTWWPPIPISTPDSGYADSTFLVAGTSGSSDAGHPGVVWQDPGTGTSEIWFLGGAQGTAVIGAANVNTAANTWRIVGMADFDGNGHPDVVWQDPVSGMTQVWFLGGVQGADPDGRCGSKRCE